MTQRQKHVINSRYILTSLNIAHHIIFTGNTSVKFVGIILLAENSINRTPKTYDKYETELQDNMALDLSKLLDKTEKWMGNVRTMH